MNEDFVELHNTSEKTLSDCYYKIFKSLNDYSKVSVLVYLTASFEIGKAPLVSMEKGRGLGLVT